MNLPSSPKDIRLVLNGQRDSILTAAHIKAHARQKGAQRIAEVDRFADTLDGPIRKIGYSIDALGAMSDLETDSWRSPHWVARLNPGGIGEFPDGSTQGIDFKTGDRAAYAMAVHLMAYARGFDNRLAQYLQYDPRYIEVLKKGWGRTVATVEGLGGDNGGKWATDTLYSKKVFDRLLDIADAIKTPQPTPQPTPGGAPLPSNIKQVATGNSHARMFGRKPIAIVYHITDALEYHGTQSWFQNPSSDASAHVVIDYDGTIYQFVSSTRAAWTNGDYAFGGQIVANRSIPVVARIVNELATVGGNFNDFTLNIEHVGKPGGTPPTEAQYRSSIAISRYWLDRYLIKPGRGRQLRHADVNSRDRAYCPGPDFDLARVIRACGGDPTTYE